MNAPYVASEMKGNGGRSHLRTILIYVFINQDIYN